MTGRPHEIEIWFGLSGATAYILTFEGSDSVKNLAAQPAVHLRIGDREWDATARVVADPHEAATARRLLAAKYQGWHEGGSMSSWAERALPVAIDLPARLDGGQARSRTTAIPMPPEMQSVARAIERSRSRSS